MKPSRFWGAGQLELKGDAWPFCRFSPRYLPNHRSDGPTGASLTLNICPTLPLNWWWIPRMTGTPHRCVAFRNCFQTFPSAATCNFLHWPSRLSVYNFLQLITGVFARSPRIYLSKKSSQKNKWRLYLQWHKPFSVLCVMLRCSYFNLDDKLFHGFIHVALV